MVGCVLVALSCLLLIPVLLSAQQPQSPVLYISPDYLYDNWTVEDGLPLNAVPSLDQSAGGYLWAGTLDGLARFDGNRFKVFNMSGYGEMPSNRTVGVLRAGRNGAFFGTEGGHLLHIDGSTLRRLDSSHDRSPESRRDIVQESDDTWLIAVDGNLYRYSMGAKVRLMADVFHAPVDGLLISRTGDLWVAARDGLYRVRDEQVVTFIPSSAGLPGGRILALAEDADGAVWAGSRSGGVSVIRGGRAQPLAGVPDSVELEALHLYADPHTGSVWIGAVNALYEYRNGELRLFQSDLGGSGSRRRTVQFDQEGNRWIAAFNRLYRNEDLVLVAASAILDVMPDEEQGVWIGTVSSGLIRMRPRYIHSLSERDGLTGDNVYTIVEAPDGSIWIGGFAGVVNRYAEGRFTSYHLDAGTGDPRVLSLMFDREGVLWAGTGYGPCRLVRERWQCFKDGPPEGRLVRGLFQDSRGTFWFGTRRGAYRFDGVRWTTPADDPNLRVPLIQAFAEAPDGSILMGSVGSGLLRYSGGRIESSSDERLADASIRGMYRDRDGILWLGTEGQGIIRVAFTESGTLAHAGVTSIRQTDGLHDETVHQILEDDHGRLWMSTNRGIFYVHRESLNAFAGGELTQIISVVHTERDGMLNREANGGGQNAGIRSSDGRLWFPTQRGVVIVDPARVPPAPPPRPAVIEEMRAAEGEFAVDAGAIRLPLGRRSFEIVYAAAAFNRPENVTFRYRLDGLEREWTKPGTRRAAYYTGVRPGSYTFLVAASNEVGEWSPVPASVQVIVPAYFHETRWFYLLCGALLIAILGGAFRYRTHRLLLRQAELTRLVEESTHLIKQHEKELREQNTRLQEQAAALMKLDALKSRFFADISHEFRTPLTLVIGPLEDVLEAGDPDVPAREMERIELALMNARRLLRLIRQILDLSRLEAGYMELNPAPLDAADFVRKIYSGFSPLAERKRMDFRSAVAAGPLVGLFDADALEKIVTNLLSNAFKFTPEEGRILLSVRALEDGADGRRQLEISVRDSGRGIAAERLSGIFDRFARADVTDAAEYEGAGIGLALVRELVHLHDGSISVKSEVGFGSEFIVQLPFHAAEVQDAPPVPGAYVAAETSGDGVGPAAEIGADHVPEHRQPHDEPTVLVVDDNREIRQFIRDRLEQDFRVEEAPDGRAGLEKAAAMLPDVILADVMMPGLDGYDFCRKVRENRALDRVPIILLTAKATEEDAIEGRRAGADDYVTKPFSTRDLEARIRSHLDARRRLVASVERRLHALPADPDAGEDRDPFLLKVREILLAHISDSSFSVDDLASTVGLSRTQLYRRVRRETGMSPGDYFREMRLHHAAALILQDAGTISEIAYASGFNSLSYFSRCFKERFGKLPSEYRPD